MERISTPSSARVVPIATPPPAPTNPTDSGLMELARRAAGGDTAATLQLLRECAPRFAAVVRGVLGPSHPDLDDVTQQALVAFVQAMPAFRGDGDPVGYGRVIVLRVAIAARRRGRALNARHDASVEADEFAQGDEPAARDLVHARRRKELVRDLLAELPVEQAEALALRVIVGCSLPEIAAQMKTPLNTVRSRIRLAKERLKARIEADPALLEALDVGEGGES